MKLYVGTVEEGVGKQVYVLDTGKHPLRLDGMMSMLPIRHDLAKHSLDGFSWGHTGSGPAQLAIALLADATDDDKLARETCHFFHDNFIAHLPMQEPWAVSDVIVKMMARGIRRVLGRQGGPWGTIEGR